jgi:hypothetical protein
MTENWVAGPASGIAECGLKKKTSKSAMGFSINSCSSDLLFKNPADIDG